MTGAKEGLEHNMQMASGSGGQHDHELLTQYFTHQLRAATLQTTGLLDEMPVGGCLNVEGVMSKVELEDYRQAESSCTCDKFAAAVRMPACMNLAAAGLKALEGCHEIAVDACTEVELQLQAKSESPSYGEAWVAGFKGLIYASKGDWAAAEDSLWRAIQVEQACVGSRFFHQFVVCLFAESLGYLIIHANHPRVPTDCPESSAYCKNSHAFYPFLFLCSGGSHPGSSDAGCLVECANLAPQWPEARCACVDAYYKAGKIGVESKSTSKIRESLLAGYQLPDALRIPFLEISMWAALGELEFEQAEYLPALTHSARALRVALMKGEEDDPVKVQALCERILKSAALRYPQLPRPPREEADSVDVLCYALCVMTLFRPDDCTDAKHEDWKKAVWEEVRLLLATKQQQSALGKIYPWIMEALEGLVGIYDRAGAYSSAAEVCVLHSTLVDLPSQLCKQSAAAFYWYKAGDVGRAVQIMEAAVAASQQLDESDWELRARIQISAASVWQKDGLDRAVAAREEAWRLCSTRTNLHELTHPEDIVKGMLSLLDNYRARRSWSSAYKLVDFMDAYMDEHLEGSQQWERWNFTKAYIARDIGDLEQAATVLRHMQEVLAGKDVVLRAHHGPPLHETLLPMVTAELHGRNGNWKLAVRKIEQALKALQRVSPRVKSFEMRMRILLCFGLEALGRHQELGAQLEAAVSEGGSDVDDSQVTTLRLLQARAALRLGDTAAAWTHTQAAETLAAKDVVNVVPVKYHQALILQAQQQWMSAAKLAGEAAVLAAAQQRETCYQDNEPTAWVLFFDRKMKLVFWLLQDLWINCLRRPEQGLLWAERANMRLLLHQIHRKGEEGQFFDPAELEQCDTLLETIIWATVRSLTPTTAIIHYVYNTSLGELYM